MQFLPNMIGVVFAPIICGEMHFLLISENLFFHDIKRDRITSLHGIHVNSCNVIDKTSSNGILFQIWTDICYFKSNNSKQ